MKTYLYVVFDNCDSGSTLFKVDAIDQETADDLFVKKALPIAPNSFEYNTFIEMLLDNDIQVKSLGEQREAIQL